MNLGLVKILSIFSSASISAGSFLCNADNLINVPESTVTILEMILNWLLTLLGNIIYYICQFALSLIDFLQIVVYKFLGITANVEDFKLYDTNNPLIKFLTNDTVIDVLRTAMIVAAVLVIVFSIFAILMGEWHKAANNTEYSVRMVWGRAFRALLGMLVFPAAFMAVIILTNSLLTSVASVIGGSSNTSLGGQVFALCSYDANVYRNYANNNKRIPIYIDFYDPYADGTHTRYTNDELAAIYGAFTTDGTELFNKFATQDFLGFSDTVSYFGGSQSLTNNYDTYGDYEKFVCTAEQYQVMADFVDYAVAHGITYYYKPISDADIEWKYVESTQYNKETGSLTLNYRDASNLTDNTSYSVVYDASPYAITSPVQDALGTLGTLLSLDGNYYSMVDYLEGSINQVSWASDKVLLKFSENYQNVNAWTVQDQILLYEYYRYSYNNTLQDYSLTDLESGVYLDAYKLECQYYRDYTNSYVTLVDYNVVIINGNYYLIEEAKKQVYNVTIGQFELQPILDDYGDPIYQIKNGSDVRLKLSDLSFYNQTNNAEMGVHIKILDDDSNEAWYSNTYGSDGVLLAKNAMHEYMPDTVGEAFEEVKDNSGVVIETLYGFKNANGFWKEVDKLKATHSVKQVDWANKLMGDLKAIYRDLNLEQLITTGEWLNVFNSEIEQIDGEYVASFDTSMISPQGIVFSEIFLGVLQESDGSNLADYMFTSKYSKQDQRELVLALCGEENYETVSLTIDYFVDTFNLLFTPLLEKIMVGEGQQFVVGEVSSIQLYTYKAYLCSLLLSSDSASFFLDIARELIVMYQFQYDILAAQPLDYTLAVNIIKEYLHPDIYGPNKLSYSFDLDRLDIDFVKYLDVAVDADGKTDGEITQEDLVLIYDKDNDNNVQIDEITVANTPKELLKQINKQIEEVYISFADIVIKENANNSVYYGINLKANGIDLQDYGFELQNGKYVIAETNVNSYNQLSKYTELCNSIYSIIATEFATEDTKCLVVKIYNNVKNNLEQQQVTEADPAWPVYMTRYKEYLVGTLLQQELLFSNIVSTQNVAGKVNEYDLYVSLYTKSLERLANLELLTQFNVSVGLLETKDEKRNSLLETYGILNVTNNQDETTLINKYYNDNTTEQERLLSLTELKQYSCINAETFTIQNTIEGYLKQKLVANQLDLIIKYAINNNLVADVLKDGELYNKNPDDSSDLILATDGEIIAQRYVTYLQDYAYAVKEAVSCNMALNEYEKYFISYAVRMNSTENVSKTFAVIVNNHRYLMSITMPTAKLTEYLLGGVYLNHLGFETAYIDSNYKGFFDISYNADGTISLPSGNSANFNAINSFIDSLADVSMKAYYMSNLRNITKSNTDNTPLNQLFYKIVVVSGQITYQREYVFDEQSKNSYVKLMLLNILKNKYLDEATTKAIMLGNQFNNTSADFYADAIKYVDEEMEQQDIYNAFNSTMSYLTGSVKDYHTLSMKQLRLELFNAVIDYQENSASSSIENKNRYITLFYMLCSDFVEKDLGTTDPITGKPNKQITYLKDTTTQSLICKLAGMEDMPVELLVGLEYNGSSAENIGYDENNGDYFIICTFDQETQMYIPFLMNSGKSDEVYQTVTEIVDGEETEVNWLKFGYGVATTEYYVSTKENESSQSFPIIAKGIITEDGMPTAIRQVDGVIEFYRDNLTIRNTSELNLNAYFMTTESISTNYNLFSLLTNSISKVFTGKTLIEHAYSNIPKFSIDSNIRLPIGVDSQVISLTESAISLDYTFMGLSGLSSQNFYTTIKINFLVLLIALIALFPMLIKALYGVFGRVVQITVSYCMSPVMMSTIALGKNSGEGKEELPIYKAWITDLSKKTLSVFGYVIGFHVFFILVPFFAGVEFISNLELFKQLPFFANVSLTFVNRVINIIMIICSAYLITEAPKVFADILGQTDGFSDGEAVKGGIKATVTEVKESLNGTKAVATINYAKESLKENLGLNTIADVTGRIKKSGSKVVSKGAEIYLRANGVPKDKAKAITKTMHQNVVASENNKKDLREERKLKAFDAYHQQVGISDTGDIHTQLQKIDERLYKNGLRTHTSKQHEAIQKQMKKIIDDDKKAKEKEKKKKKKK